MKKVSIVLHLNAIGQKAIGSETKNLQIEVEPNTDITAEVIDSAFPMSLVDHFEVKESFANLQEGDYVKVIDLNGKGHLGRVNYINNQYINVTLEDYELLNLLRENWTNFSDDFHPYQDSCITFNMFGIEKTRCKQKLRITNISGAEIKYCKEYIENATRNKPLVEILKTLTDASNLNIDFNDLKLIIPKWMTPTVLHNVYSILNNAKNNYDEYEDTDYN